MNLLLLLLLLLQVARTPSPTSLAAAPRVPAPKVRLRVLVVSRAVGKTSNILRVRRADDSARETRRRRGRRLTGEAVAGRHGHSAMGLGRRCWTGRDPNYHLHLDCLSAGPRLTTPRDASPRGLVSCAALRRDLPPGPRGNFACGEWALGGREGGAPSQ